jgi:NAD(P)-dependent dehydrogenase (short-subunit alcohol dehydrogenase family)
MVEEIKNIGRKAVPKYGDVSKLPQVEFVVEMSVKNLGDLDVMVVNAGIVTAH